MKNLANRPSPSLRKFGKMNSGAVCYQCKVCSHALEDIFLAAHFSDKQFDLAPIGRL
jgi:hypothetical protein